MIDFQNKQKDNAMSIEIRDKQRNSHNSTAGVYLFPILLATKCLVHDPYMDYSHKHTIRTQKEPE